MRQPFPSTAYRGFADVVVGFAVYWEMEKREKESKFAKQYKSGDKAFSITSNQLNKLLLNEQTNIENKPSSAIKSLLAIFSYHPDFIVRMWRKQ